MPWFVNGQPVPEELIRQELAQIGRHPNWANIADEKERTNRMREAAERSAQDKILLAQAAARDERPIDSAAIEPEVRRLKQNGGCRTSYDDTGLRQVVEHSLRVQRLTQEIIAGAAKPTQEEIEAFYRVNRENFRLPETFHAAHIVKHVNEDQSEEQAEAGIQAALADLENGMPFGEAAEHHSDCKGNGGDLGTFPSGHMVDEFESAIRALEPGERSGIFTTPFGFHIAELRTRTSGGAAALDDVRADIEAAFTTRNQHELLVKAVGELRSRADIRFVAENSARSS